MMKQSEQINELAAALAKAQGEITGAKADSENTFYKSKYADLASCWDACRKQLSENGLAVLQPTMMQDGTLYVVTTLVHTSGQWVSGWLPVRARDDTAGAQGAGLTYSRRQGLAAMIGLAQIDDDGEEDRKARDRVIPVNHGELLTDKQAAYAKEFADAFRKTLNSDVDEELKATHVATLVTEANEDQLVFIEASKQLTAGERSAIKKYNIIGRKER